MSKSVVSIGKNKRSVKKMNDEDLNGLMPEHRKLVQEARITGKLEEIQGKLSQEGLKVVKHLDKHFNLTKEEFQRLKKTEEYKRVVEWYKKELEDEK